MEEASIASAVVAVIAAVLSWLLLRETRRTAKATEREATAAEKSAEASEDAAAAALESLEIQRSEVHRTVSKEVEARRPGLIPDSQRPSPGAFNLRETEPRELSAWVLNSGPGSAKVVDAFLHIGGIRQIGHIREGNNTLPTTVVDEGESVNLVFFQSPELDAFIRQPEAIELDVKFMPASRAQERWWITVALAPVLSDGGRKHWRAVDFNYRLDA